jgi:hypothetical protein
MLYISCLRAHSKLDRRTEAVRITTLLVSYWLLGCCSMTVKRYSEYRGLCSEPLVMIPVAACAGVRLFPPTKVGF